MGQMPIAVQGTRGYNIISWHALLLVYVHGRRCVCIRQGAQRLHKPCRLGIRIALGRRHTRLSKASVE